MIFCFGSSIWPFSNSFTMLTKSASEHLVLDFFRVQLKNNFKGAFAQCFTNYCPSKRVQAIFLWNKPTAITYF